MNVNIIVAIQDCDYGIGLHGDQPYSFKEDFKQFKEKTKGGVVIMGRKTWETIPEKFRPLEGRKNIVVTRNKDYKVLEGVLLASSYEEAKILAQNHDNGNIWNIGGGSLYKQAIEDKDTKELHITRILGQKNCDVHFPSTEKFFLREKNPNISSKNKFDKEEYFLRFEVWERKS